MERLALRLDPIAYMRCILNAIHPWGLQENTEQSRQAMLNACAAQIQCEKQKVVNPGLLQESTEQKKQAAARITQLVQRMCNQNVQQDIVADFKVITPQL